MIKVARKPSTDPLQEKLRQNKALWNKDISAFISDLINLKKTMNGWPSKFHQEKSFIKDPIPADPVTLLGALSGDFQELAQKGNSIVQEQLDYSKTRRRKQVKAPGQPVTGTPPTTDPGSPDLSQQLELPHTASLALDMIKVASVFEEKYGLVSEGSNAISRFFAKLLNPGIGFSEAARVRRVRMQLLRASADVFKKLEKFQINVVKSSANSIEVSNTLMHDVWRDWETVRTGFNTYKSMMPVTVPDSGGELETPKSVLDIKKKEKEEANNPSSKTDSRMEKIDRAVEDDKPEPDDADYQRPSEEEEPNWGSGNEQLVNEFHEQQNIKLANWAKSDFHFALRNMSILSDNGIPITVFEKLEEYVKNFSIRNKWALLVIQAHKEVLDYLNGQFDTMERSFRDVIILLKGRAKAQAILQQERKKLQTQQQKDKDNGQKTIDKAKQKALLNVPPAPPAPPVPPASPVAPPSVTDPGPSTEKSASAQLEVTAQAFIKKWLGKTRHQMMGAFDQTSSQRLQIFEVADEMSKTVDNVMDHLEKDLNVAELAPMIDKVNRQMTTIRALTRNLHNVHKPKPKKK